MSRFGIISGHEQCIESEEEVGKIKNYKKIPLTVKKKLKWYNTLKKEHQVFYNFQKLLAISIGIFDINYIVKLP